MGSIKLVLILIMLSAAGGGYIYVQNLQKNLEVSQANNARLETAVQTNEETIKVIQAASAAASEELKKVNKQYADIRRQNNILADKLAGMDIGLLASQKPDSIERAVNSGTKNAGRCFEILSGSPLVEAEVNAKNDREFNKECPWLWPGNVAGSGLLETSQSN
jgi:ABC-type multidrug transport system fused ATPase/permease subunit